MGRPRRTTPEPPRSRPELASIYLDVDVIEKLEAEAARRGATRTSVADEIIGQLADEAEGKAPPLLIVRCSVTL